MRGRQFSVGLAFAFGLVGIFSAGGCVAEAEAPDQGTRFYEVPADGAAPSQQPVDRPSTNDDDEDGEGVVRNPKPNSNGGDEDDEAEDESEDDAGSSNPGPKKDGGTTSVSCEATRTCQDALDLGSANGDIDGPAISRQGTTSEWFKVRITEGSASVVGYPQKVTISLISPEGANFDVFAYVNTEADEVQCSSASASSLKPQGTTDQLSLSWGDAYWVGSRYDDSRTVSIEVRHVSGDCNPNARWTLMVQGNR